MKIPPVIGRRIVACVLLGAALSGCARPVPDSLAPDSAESVSSNSISAGPNRMGPPVVDLTGVDFSSDRVYLMPARWDFYWRRFLTSEDIREDRPEPDARVAGLKPWTRIETAGEGFPGQGYATYRMLLRVPADREYGFRIQQQLTSFRLYVNGDLKIQAGRADTSRAASTPERKNYSFFALADAPELEIILHVSNFHAFRGGLRGTLTVGNRAAIERYTLQRIAIDFGLFGFFLAVFLYHLAFYLMHPGERSFLFFALLCLSFLLRVPIFGEKVITFIAPEVSWDWHMRSLVSLNIVSPLLLIALLRSVFPNAVSRRIVAAYTLISLPFMVTLVLDSQYIQPAMFLLYLIVLVPLLSHSVFLTVKMTLSGSVSALFMALAIVLVVIPGWYAMYLNWKAQDAAPFALFGFASFTLFNALALGRRYRENLTARAVLRERLAQSRSALVTQRRELEMNLHDSLGGALTDFKMLIERALEKAVKNVEFDVGGWLETLRERLERTNRTFRGQLLFMEDLELVARDPAIGLRMMLLRRYTDAGRELDFTIPPNTVSHFRRAMADDGWRINLIQLARELCTNDLKYGAGESRWSISLHDGAHEGPLLELWQSNWIAKGAGNPSSQDREAGKARQRALQMGGELHVEREDERFCALARLPFRIT